MLVLGGLLAFAPSTLRTFGIFHIQCRGISTGICETANRLKTANARMCSCIVVDWWSVHRLRFTSNILFRQLLIDVCLLLIVFPWSLLYMMQVREAYWHIGTPILVLSRALQLSADFLEEIAYLVPRSATAVFAAPSQSSPIVCHCNMSQIWSFYTLSFYFKKKRVN